MSCQSSHALVSLLWLPQEHGQVVRPAYQSLPLLVLSLGVALGSVLLHVFLALELLPCVVVTACPQYVVRAQSQ